MHWKNSNFQIVAFIVGKCHTADEAYRKLLMQRQEREQALTHAKVTALRTQAAVLRAKKALESQDESEQLEAQAALAEVEGREDVVRASVEEAQREVEFIDRLLHVIGPHRKYKDLPDHEAFQAIQREEWAWELIRRAQNFLYCAGTIPTDHFDTMRSHPDFAAVIAPVVTAMQSAIAAKDLARLNTFSYVPAFQRALAETEVFGPAPDFKAVLAQVRAALPQGDPKG